MKKKIKVTPELIEKLKPYWQEMNEAYNALNEKLDDIVSKMADETGIEDIDFFWADGWAVSIRQEKQRL